MKQLVAPETTTFSTNLKSLFDLRGRVALVTGGSGWLGTAISEALVEMGASVTIASRNEEASQNTANDILNRYADGRIESLHLDLNSQKSVIKCFEQVMEREGRLDILVNNAHSGTTNSIEDSGLEEWQQIIDTSLTGYYLCINKSLEYMRDRGGSIINIASMYGMVSPNPSVYDDTEYSSSPAYGAAKAGILQLTRYAACHLAKYKIRVNAISPGPFPCPKVRETNQFAQALSQKNPMKRLGEPWEMKSPIAFLASEASSFVTGQNIVVDGGWTAW